MTRTVAAIDCGTNSIRLLIAEEADTGGLLELDRRTRIVRLGQDVDRTGRFADEALQRTFEAVDEFAEAIAGHDVAAIRFGATSATRDVSNRGDFIEGVRSRLGVAPEVVSGDDEARLSFTGATLEAAAAGGGRQERVLVVDLGGGSTEFVVGRVGQGTAVPEKALSTDMGSVRFTERYLRRGMGPHDRPSSNQIDSARQAAREMLDRAEHEVGLRDLDRVIGVAGTITTIVAAALDLQEYSRQAIHGARIEIETLRSAAMSLVLSDRAGLQSLPFLHPGRVDVIAAGGLIVDEILARVTELNPNLTHAEASETDILDGIALRALEDVRARG